jgi:hypothetical protein
VIITQPGTSPRWFRPTNRPVQPFVSLMLLLSVGRRYGASRLSPTTPG